MYILHALTKLKSISIPRNFTGIAESNNGSKEWYSDGRRHRIFGPAIERENGTKYWYVEGEHHRLDGPAIEYPSGSKYWYINNKQVTEEQHKVLVENMNKPVTCDGKLVEVDGKKYKMVLVD